MAIEWKTINPDFSDSTASMRNALTGFSEAGTVFDKMRQGILDEEQRALENAYKQQVFDENVRQFEAELAANEAKALADREHDKAMADLRQRYELAQIAERHKNTLELEAGKRQRHSSALTLGTDTYNARIKAGDTPAQALDAANIAVRNAGFGDLGIDPINYVHMGDRNAVEATLSKEYQAKQAMDTLRIAANAAKEISGNDSVQYKDFMSRLVSVDGELAIRDTNGVIRALKPEEQSYFNSVTNVDRADTQPERMNRLIAAQNVLASTGINPVTANTAANRMLTAVGEQNLVNETGLHFGLTDSSAIAPTDLADRVKAEIKTREEVEAKERANKVELADDRKYRSFDKAFTDFSGMTLKVAGSDDKAKITAISNDTLKYAEQIKDTFYDNGLTATDYKQFLNILKQDEIGGRTDSWFKKAAAEEFVARKLAEVENSKGIGNNEEAGRIENNESVPKTAKNKAKEKSVEEKTAEEIRAEFAKDREPIAYTESEKTKAKNKIPSLEARQRQMERVLKRTNLTKSERADAQEDLDRIKKELKTLRDLIKG